MNSLKKTIQDLLVNLWVFKYKHVSQKQLTRVLMYHSIGDPIPDDYQGRYAIGIEKFKEQMELLKDLGVPLVKLSYPFIKEGISVTFDDGYKNNLEIAYPILKSLNIPFTVFISTNNFDDKSGIYLTKNDVKYLLQDPLVSIGSHGVTHRPLTHLSDDELFYELSKSKNILEDLAGKSIDGISYPHGAYDERIIRAVQMVGYKWAANSIFGTITPKTSPYELKRTDIWSWDTSAEFKCKLIGGHDWRGLFKN